MCKRTSWTTARGFTVVVVPLVLAVSLVVLAVMLANKPTSPGSGAAAYDAGKKWGPVIGGALFAAFMLGLASRIADNRGHKAATFIIGGILLLANFAFLMNVLGLAKPVPKAQRGGTIARMLSGNQNAEPPATARPAEPAPEPPRAAPTAPRSFDPSRANPRSANPARTVPSPTLPATEPPPTPTPDPTPTPPDPPAEPDSPDFATVAAFLGAEVPQATATLEALAKELGDLTADLAMKAAVFVPEALETPKHDRAALKKRLDEARAIESLALEAASRLRRAQELAGLSLTKAGVRDHDRMSLSIRFATMTNSSARAFAAADYARFAADVAAEATLLDKHFAKWKLDRDKKITSEDFKVRGELTGPRMRVESFEHRAERCAEGLGGQ